MDPSFGGATMSKRTFVIFGIFAVLFGLAIPYWAISKEGSEEVPADVSATGSDEGELLFQTNCGACHTLEAAGTDGIVGPDLDDVLGSASPEATDANTTRVLNAIENGIEGRMPAGILRGEDAELVAEYVARSAGQ